MGKATFFIGYLNSLTVSTLLACCSQCFFGFMAMSTILPNAKSGIPKKNLRPSFSVYPIRC